MNLTTEQEKVVLDVRANMYKHKIKQCQLSLLTGINNSYLSMKLNGKMLFTEDELQKINKVFNTKHKNSISNEVFNSGHKNSNREGNDGK